MPTRTATNGEGLAVLHPTYYRHIFRDGLGKFTRFATNVWGLNPADYADEEELALAGIQALENFIRECGLPGMRELGVDESTDLREIADSCYTAGGASGKSGRMKYMRSIKECF